MLLRRAEARNEAVQLSHVSRDQTTGRTSTESILTRSVVTSGHECRACCSFSEARVAVSTPLSCWKQFVPGTLAEIEQ